MNDNMVRKQVLFELLMYKLDYLNRVFLRDCF